MTTANTGTVQIQKANGTWYTAHVFGNTIKGRIKASQMAKRYAEKDGDTTRTV